VTQSSQPLLVTGASGFLGSRVVCLAREAGWRVRVFDRTARFDADGIETFVGDISDCALLRRASDGVAAIVHAAGLAHVVGSAARNSSAFNAVNDVGTGNVVDAALICGVPRVILVSSVSVYGSYSGKKCDELVSCLPVGPYAVSKWRGELRATERMATGRGTLTILRFATMYGEEDRGNVARLIGALDRNRFVWPGDGANQKSLIYKDDAARACLRTLDHPASSNEVFNVSSPPASMREIVTGICQALGRPVPRFGIPLPILNACGAIARRIGDPGHFDQRLQKFIRDDVYDGTKFERAYGYSPVVSLAGGLQREVGSMQRRLRA
jgi:nucleoside-diphosphate-sugar epimerase